MVELDPTVMLGSQYYINNDDTPQQVRAGIQAMSRAGLKLVRIFLQWTQVEPRAGRWDWAQYDALFDAAAEGGIGVVITLTALHPPGWMKITAGPQDLGPLFDEAYWERARDYIRRVAARYGKHPAMHSWILNNEPQLILDPSPEVLQHFQRFVAGKYSGDIERLNRRSFQQLDSFEEVPLPATKDAFTAYSGRLNWLDFMVFRLQEILVELQKTIRETGDQHPTHVNPHGLLSHMYPQGQSIWAEGRLVDFLGCSAHPAWHSVRFLPERIHQSVGLFADMMRGATRALNRYFWVTELQGGTNIYSGLTYLGPTEEDIRTWIWEAIGAGAKGVVFWCFNYRTQGYEAGEWSLVDQQGRPSRRLAAASHIAALLERHKTLFAASQPARAQVALLCSEATWKLGNIEGQGEDPDYPRNALMGADALAGAFQAFADAGLAVDIIDEVDLQNGLASAYPILVLPGCTALEDSSLPALQRYVTAGGTLLADGLCGYKQPDGYLRGVAANPLNDLFQASVADIQAIPEVETTQTTEDLPLPVWFLQISLDPQEKAEVLARFNERDPRPAMTRAVVGQGQAIRLGTVFFQHYFRHPDLPAFAHLLSRLPVSAGLVTLRNPGPNLRLRELALPDGALLVLINSGAAVEADLRVEPGVMLALLSADGIDPLQVHDGSTKLHVPACDSLVIHLKKQGE